MTDPNELPAYVREAIAEYHSHDHTPTGEAARRLRFELAAFRIALYGIPWAESNIAELRRLEKSDGELFGEIRYELERLGLSRIDIQKLLRSGRLPDVVSGGWRSDAREAFGASPRR